jgi:hypothetical protein
MIFAQWVRIRNGLWPLSDVAVTVSTAGAEDKSFDSLAISFPRAAIAVFGRSDLPMFSPGAARARSSQTLASTAEAANVAKL